MNKKFVLSISLSILCIICIVYVFAFQTKEKETRTYKFETDSILDSAYLNLKDDNTFEFNYSLLSSTIPDGEYKTIEGKIYCYDNSEYEDVYVFNIENNILSFNADLSSELPGYSKIQNGSIFK